MRFFGLGLSLAVACHGSDSNNTPQTDAGNPDGSVGPDAALLDPVTFTYNPSWGGVNRVDVLGAFGQGSGVDWVTPLVTLTAGSNGSFMGSAMLPAGAYPFLFHVVGDNAAGSALGSAYARYSLDETVSEYEACPAGAPTAGSDMNPCSIVTVPQDNPETMYAIKGTVDMGGSAAHNYLVVLERDEGSASHHFFVNRTGTGSNGTYTLRAAAGNYRIQVQWSGYESTKDNMITNPVKTDVVRRTISTAFDVAATTMVSIADVTPPDYAMFGPSGSAGQTPTTFTFPAVASTQFEIYPPGNEIVDPVYHMAAAAGSATFDGKLADGSNVGSAETYYWGVEWVTAPIAEGSGGSDNGAKWTAQSLGYMVSWPNE